MGMKVVELGRKVKYPITVTKLLKRRGDQVEKEDSVFEYTYTWYQEVGDPTKNETWQEKQVTPATWSSPVDGKILSWKIREGQVINKDGECMEVDEPCDHSVQFGGMCVRCMKDMSEVSWAAESKDSDRATINMIHDQTLLTVSKGEAFRAEEEQQRRLLKNRKLSLVVDLDQTVIHACIEPTVGEWQNDKSSPNYEAVKDVRAFQLPDDGPQGVGPSGVWYYIKMRPGLEKFLAHMAELYELHVYTMGTRAYAQNVCAIIDPERKLFGDRIISRNENGSLTAKTLERLFPRDTKMVVIIDDRSDVWPKNKANLIKVVPFDFFVGIGDINSSFLPKRQELPSATKKAAESVAENTPIPVPAPETPTGDSPSPEIILLEPSENQNTSPSVETDGKTSALQGLMEMAGGDDPTTRKLQVEEQAEFLEKQLTERPLLQMQQQLEKEDEAADAEENSDEVTKDGAEVEHPHARHNLLKDDDTELDYLDAHLTNLHKAFYDEYDRRLVGNQGGPVARLKPGQSRKLAIKENVADLSIIPDVGEEMPKLKRKTLAGTVIVLSGLVPLGADVMSSEIVQQAESFGAQVHVRISRKVTHVVVSASRVRTQKVRQASKYPHIKIVNHNWLIDSLSKWRKEDEAPYEVAVPRNNKDSPDGFETSADDSTAADSSDDSSSSEDDMNASFGDGKNGADGEATSPIDDLKTFDWQAADDELAEFMAESGDESDAESIASHNSTQTNDSHVSIRAAKHTLEDTTDEEGSDKESHIAKKKRLALSRSTGLKTVSVQSDSSLPTPEVTGDDIEEVDLIAAEPASSQPIDDGDIDDDDLEAEMLAEFEKESAEEDEDEEEREEL